MKTSEFAKNWKAFSWLSCFVLLSCVGTSCAQANQAAGTYALAYLGHSDRVWKRVSLSDLLE